MNPSMAAKAGPIMTACMVMCLLASACGPAAAASPATQPGPLKTETAARLAVPTETAPPTSTPTAVPDLTAAPGTTAPQVLLWLPEYLPRALRTSLRLPPGVEPAGQEAEAGARLVVLDRTPRQAGAVPWVYALVAPFPTIEDELGLVDLKTAWQLGAQAGALPQRLLVDPSTQAVFEILWGPASGSVRTLPSARLQDAAWQEPGTWAIVPFEQLDPRWKVLAVNGQSPVRKDFDPLAYSLTVYFGLESQAAGSPADAIQLPASNYRPDRLTTVILTGVTALVRGTASLMEREGMTYPARDIGPWLREADILHVNNEVPFAPDCPQPYNWEGLVFCSQTEYIELLESIGTDVVELSGDHFKDWGLDATLYTIDLYDERGWQYYGGGRNASDAREPALFEHNGNRIAFIGCNAKEPGYSSAGDTTPGAVHCDFSRLARDVRRLRREGYLPIVTFQHLEYYTYTAHPLVQQDFRRMANAGAVIVSGSQAHQPQAFEFKEDALMHYGLGNLFFDQTNQGEPPRTAFIDRHIFYAGRHISTELLTIYFVDWARARPMTVEERRALLKTVFEASGWDAGSQ